MEPSVLRWAREMVDLIPVAAVRKIGVPQGRVDLPGSSVISSNVSSWCALRARHVSRGASTDQADIPCSAVELIVSRDLEDDGVRTTQDRVSHGRLTTSRAHQEEHQMTTGAFELPQDLLQRAVHASRGRTQQEVVIEALQEYIRHHEDEQQRATAIEDGLALLTSGDLDHPTRDSAWH